MRWFEAVDLHGCTIEQARDAVLQIIQMAKMKIKMSSKLCMVKAQKRS